MAANMEQMLKANSEFVLKSVQEMFKSNNSEIMNMMNKSVDDKIEALRKEVNERISLIENKASSSTSSQASSKKRRSDDVEGTTSEVSNIESQEKPYPKIAGFEVGGFEENASLEFRKNALNDIFSQLKAEGKGDFDYKFWMQGQFGPKAQVVFKTVESKKTFKDTLRESLHNKPLTVLGDTMTLYWHPIRVGLHKKKYGLTFQMYKFLKDQQEQKSLDADLEVKTGNDTGDIYINGYKIAFIMFKDEVPTMKFIDKNIKKFKLESMQELMVGRFSELIA